MTAHRLQVGPNRAGLFCNIRREGTGSIDFEIGADLMRSYRA